MYVNITGSEYELMELRGQVRRTAFVRNTGTMAGACWRCGQMARLAAAAV